ncbi:hypothetical protein AUEXF2481DRAFT_312924 [Aureobasidium subglaciale EXF-2481]|uniref:Uncharacterized protein n=1 Tax=Aureobasidium subglaciale (strain EXF-2481) TaxID=1043005 RepID=A0A074Z4F7_AURSE|nr:uncharacterized protein AUEXF2481DRAFT_312924 [Aureobasidium subglaciale EXF-2481]KEQ93886.1 hypothetical protein AUEXF2481DRAFT_312924 [Aureobasidium subglaciale EXF-2481]
MEPAKSTTSTIPSQSSARRVIHISHLPCQLQHASTLLSPRRVYMPTMRSPFTVVRVVNSTPRFYRFCSNCQHGNPCSPHSFLVLFASPSLPRSGPSSFVRLTPRLLGGSFPTQPLGPRASICSAMVIGSISPHDLSFCHATAINLIFGLVCCAF